MADERYEWLDKDAAERLLRGEPVEAADEHARIQAARLSRALEGVGRADYSTDGEMPGEAAALAAFRKARADAAAPAGDAIGTVRLARSTRSAPGLRFGRPVRFGIAAAVAGCALGGVAVAAGTGMLPGPFSNDDPLPASSISAAATPGPLVSELPTGGGPDSPSQTPGGISTPPVSPSPSGGPGPHPDQANGGKPDDDGKQQGDAGKKRSDRNAEWYRRTAEACRDYRSGRIAPERKRRLEATAKGPERVERFCDRVLSGDIKTTPDGSGDGDGGDDGGDGQSNGGSDSDDGRPGGGSLPPVSWSPLPAASPTVPSVSTR
ncbi:hypothetical protein ACFWDI_14430 [Streptomyces sp. NPDC060064]|uniref:hypothetical protein n=1 Tax=Streptomyces sp. NPDC060064 TaxID=3347049 RepID=UPI00367721DC